VSANYVDTEYTLFLALACAHSSADSPYKPVLASSIKKGLPSAQACFENLAHSHLVVSSSTAAVLVDPNFRDQFLITAPSVRYAAVLECVPEEFVGGSSRLTALVEFLSGVTFCAYVGCLLSTDVESSSSMRCSGRSAQLFKLRPLRRAANCCSPSKRCEGFDFVQ